MGLRLASLALTLLVAIWVVASNAVAGNSAPAPPTPVTADGSDAGFPYRRLEVGDFRGDAAPTPGPSRPGHIDAASCVSIATDPETSAAVTEQPNEYAGAVRVSLTELRFRAIFHPDCSWWGPGVDDVGYTLRHEQIHFAIVESAARKLTQRLREGDRSIHSVGPGVDAAVKQLRAIVDALASGAHDETDELHREFDAETAADRSAEAQEVWWDRFVRPLDENAPGAGTP